MYRTILVWLLILQLLLTVISNESPPTIRQTANGPVEGIEKISSLGQKYYSFRGIPFAEVPITGTDPYTGEQVDRRFKAPAPLKRQWTDASKVHDFEKSCAQRENGPDFPVETSEKGEDCLYLNVHVPAGGSEKKTVLAWIYGGGFNVGDATDYLYGPDFLLSQDNIVVTINYRLGIFGFLNLNFGEYTGNMGLKDQQLALKWIHENIEHFSGNNSEVLLFGQSAGGASVHLQMLNRQSRSYFQRALPISGSAFHTYVLSAVNHVELMQKCSNITEMDKLVDYLRTESSKPLMNCGSLVTLDPLLLTWSPVIERNDTNHAFLTERPEDIYNHEAPIMDTMFSFTSQELLLILMLMGPSVIYKPLIKENVMDTTIIQLPFKGFTKTAYPKEYEDSLKILRKTFFLNVTNADAIKRSNADLLSDIYVNYNKLKAAAFQAKANHNDTNEIGPKNTFLLRFNVTADFNLMNRFGKNLTDANHCDDLCYMFHCHYLDGIDKRYDKHLESKDFHYDLIMRSVRMITNFARTGDPSIEGDTPFKSSNSIDEMFCQEAGNELKTSVTHDIRQQLHYDVWHGIEEIYKSLHV